MSAKPALSSIPHRPPFLFVDEILAVQEGRILTRWHVPRDAPFFEGHFPARPVLPGVIVCESCFQAGALLMAHRAGPFGEAGPLPVVTRISDARFRRMVLPGDELRVEVTLDDELDRAFCMTGRASVDGAPAARVGFVCMTAVGEDIP